MASEKTDLVRVELAVVESTPALCPDVARIAVRIIVRDIDALGYLGDH